VVFEAFCGDTMGFKALTLMGSYFTVSSYFGLPPSGLSELWLVEFMRLDAAIIEKVPIFFIRH